MATPPYKVLVIEHSLPHYHVPAWAAVARHPAIDLTVAYGKGFFTGEDGVPEGRIEPEMNVRTVVEPSIVRRFAGRPILWHGAALRELESTRYDVVIHQFETKMVSLWKARGIQRKRKQKFVLWGIGESLKPTPLLDFVRRRLARTADAMVFYADANREKYISMGIDENRLFVARNLIDIEPIRAAAAGCSADQLEKFAADHRLESGPVLLSVGRLMQRKRIDLLLRAAARLRDSFPDLTVVIIGDGPEMEALRSLAAELGLADSVLFPGRIADEAEIAPWFLCSDLVVAPGQIGHLATHAHAYGVPLIAGDDRSVQGPEIEILQPGRTGHTYCYDDLDSLAAKISQLLGDHDERDRMAAAARDRCDRFCSVEIMATGFINAVLHVMEGVNGSEVRAAS